MRSLRGTNRTSRVSSNNFVVKMVKTGQFFETAFELLDYP
jgi:hypothetical protein